MKSTRPRRKIAPSAEEGGIGAPTYYAVPWAYSSPHAKRRLSIGSAVLAQLMVVSVGHTDSDRAISVAIGHILQWDAASE